MSHDDMTFDGMSEAVAMGMVMAPPEGFLEEAVARGLAVVEAEEALVAVQQEREVANDAAKPRRGSGVIDLRLTPPDGPPASARR
jgi:hypothetical protein